MSDPLTPAAGLAALAKLLPPAIGAAISLRLNTTDITFGKRLLAFAAALALGHYLGAALTEHYNLTGPKADAARLLIALYGLNLTTLAAAQLPTFIDTARRRILGEPQ